MTEYGDMCPNCCTPWKCNGPHLQPDADPGPIELELVSDDRGWGIALLVIAGVSALVLLAVLVL